MCGALLLFRNAVFHACKKRPYFLYFFYAPHRIENKFFQRKS